MSEYILKSYVLHTWCVYKCCYESLNKWRLFRSTGLNDWILQPRLTVFTAR